jgi:allantoin racemase
VKILVLNPNTSELVTARLAAVVEAIRRPDTTVAVRQVAEGPEALESSLDESMVVPHVLEEVRAAALDGTEAIVIAAFCDPGLDAAREMTSIPVYGLEETTLSVALLLGNRFGILTERAHKVAVKQQRIRRYGFESRCAGVRALRLGVVELARDPALAREVGLATARRLIDDDGADVIVMGCASLAGQGRDFEQALGIPVLDPLAVTFKVAEGLTDLGVRHSKHGLYATPVPQAWHSQRPLQRSIQG